MYQTKIRIWFSSEGILTYMQNHIYYLGHYKEEYVIREK